MSVSETTSNNQGDMIDTIVEGEIQNQIDKSTSSDGMMTHEQMFDLISQEMSEPTVSVEEGSTTQETGSMNNAGLRDSSGNVFDPNIHAVDKDGKVVVTKTGKFRKRHRSKIEEPSPQIRQVQSANELGQATANLIFAASITVFGEVMTPLKNDDVDEPLEMKSAFAAYYQATGKTDLPPGIALLVTIGGYYARRVNHPTFRSRVKSVFGKVFSIFKRKKKKDAAHDHNG